MAVDQHFGMTVWQFFPTMRNDGKLPCTGWHYKSHCIMTKFLTCHSGTCHVPGHIEMITRVTTCVLVDKLRWCRTKNGDFRLQFWNAWCRDMPGILILRTIWSVAPRNRKYKDKGIYHAAHEGHIVRCSASRNGRLTVFAFLSWITVVMRFASQRLLCTLGWSFRSFGTVFSFCFASCWARFLTIIGGPNCCTVVS